MACMKNSDFFPYLYEPPAENDQKILIEDRCQTLNKSEVIRLVQTVQHNLTKITNGIAGSRVGFCSDNSVLSIVLEMTLVHMGMTFVPLSPSFSLKSLTEICKEYEIKYLFIDSMEQAENFTTEETLQVLPMMNLIRQQPAVFLNSLRQSEISELFPAYILLTSGSTGKPKATAISYRNLLTFIDNAIQTFQFSSQERFASISRLTFDLSLFDIFISQKLGAYLYILSSTSETFNPYPTFVNKQISVALLVPSASRLIAAILKGRMVEQHSLQKLFFCGELLYYEDLLFWKMNASLPIKCINLYGPTEATIAFSYFDCSSGESKQSGPVPIGSPFSGQTFSFQEVPDLGLFELQLVGSQVSDFGYLKTKNEMKFQRDTKVNSFMSGDLVEKDQGQILWRSRSDNQVKVLGHRVDLDGLAIKLFAATRVVGHFVLDPDQKVLTCFIVDPEIDIENLFDRIQSEFLPYEMPRRVIKLNEFPLGPHGKISKSKLHQILERGE